MELDHEELDALRNLIEDDLETSRAYREHVLEGDDVDQALEVADHEALMRQLHNKVDRDIKGGG